MALIELRGLRKTFRVLGHRRGLWGAARNLLSAAGRDVVAVAGLDLQIEAGEFVGLVGPNGAGKSTTVKMLTGILVPSGGVVTVDGRVPHRQRREHAFGIGVVFGQRSQLWWDLPPVEAFALLGTIYRVPRATLAARLAELEPLLELAPLLDVPVRKLSLGQRMRCELAAALLHEPPLLLLDEPTIGLDVVAKQRIRDLLARLNRERGTTVLLTTHDLDDIEQLCRRVLVIDHGRILHDDTPAGLKRRFGNRRRLIVDLADDGPLELPDGATLEDREGRRLRIVFDADRIGAPTLIGEILAARPIVDLTVQEIDIETVVREIYETGADPAP